MLGVRQACYAGRVRSITYPRASATSRRPTTGAIVVAVLLAFLVLGYALVHIDWVGRNEQLVKFDVVHHLDEYADLQVTSGAIGEHVEGAWRQLGERIKLLNVRAGQHLMWPRLMYAIGSGWEMLFGGGIKAPLYANLLFVLILVAGVWGVMRQVGRGMDPALGLVAGEGTLIALGLALFYPGVFGPLRLYGQYAPLGCCLVGVLALLMASRGFARAWVVVALAFAAGLTMLIKPLLPFYLGLPLLCALLLAVTRRPQADLPGDGRLRRWIHVAGAAGIVAALTHIWLAGRVGDVLQESAAHLVPGWELFADGVPNPHTEDYPAWSLAWLTYHLRAGVAGLGLAGCLGLGAALVLLIVRRARLGAAALDGRVLLLLAAFGAPLLLTFVSSKEARFLFPVYPLLALVTALGLMTLPALWRRLVTGALATLGIASMLGLSYSPSLDDRVQRLAWEHLGGEEGDLWAGAPGEARFPGLAAAEQAVIDQTVDRANARIAYLAVPQGDDRMDERIDWVREHAVRTKVGLGCITEDWDPFFTPEVPEHLCHLETVDLRFYDPGYLETASLHVVLVFHFPDAVDGLEPPYTNRIGEPLPEIAYARTVEELDRHLGGGDLGLNREKTWSYHQPEFEHPVDVHYYLHPFAPPPRPTLEEAIERLRKLAGPEDP